MSITRASPEMRQYLYEMLEQLPEATLSEVARFVETLRSKDYQSTRDAKESKAKIHAEAQAFRSMHRELLSRYRGRYVAVHDGRVVDDDMDRRSLYLRVRARYGATPVLIREVTELPEREFHILSPRLESDPL